MGSCKLPHSDFHWLTHEEIQQIDIENFNSDGSVGLILQCDLQYPNHLHDKHKYYPLAPESLSITYDMLSPHALNFLEKNKAKFSTQTRLVGSVKDKIAYTLHIKNLQFYLKEGLTVTKIHRVIGFHQSAWLKPFIDFNINKRREAKTEFLSALYKLVCNSVFG